MVPGSRAKSDRAEQQVIAAKDSWQRKAGTVQIVRSKAADIWAGR